MAAPAAAHPPGLHRLHAEAVAGAALALSDLARRRADRRDQAVSRLVDDLGPVRHAVLQRRGLRAAVGRRHDRAARQHRPRSTCWSCWRWPTGCRSRGSSKSRARSSSRCCRPAPTPPATPRSAASRARRTPSAAISTTCSRSSTIPEGRVIVTIGDVAGKGSPAALLMALLLAVLRTLVDEKLEARALVARLNTQICRHSPGSRFITLFYGVYTPSTGALTYVNAGQNPPLLRRADGIDRAARRDRHRAGDVRGLDLRGGRHDRRPRRSAGALQRRHHRSGEPGRASPSRRAGSSASSRRAAATRRPCWPRRSSRPSKRTRATRGSRTI